MPSLRIHLLGGLTLFWDERPLSPIPGTVARSLLAYLITTRDRPHTRHLLAGTFWPDLPDATARRRLSRALWQIRRVLAPVRDTLDMDVLLTEGDAVQINPRLPLKTDVDDFVKLQAPNSKLQRFGIWNLEFGVLRDAVALYRGEFLAGYYDDWLLGERERLREMFLAVLERLVEGYKSRGEYEQALIHVRRLAGEAPWREEAHREVMRLCHLLGRDNEALRHFEACRQTLVRELGAEPSPETVALVREIAGGNDQAFALDLPEVPPPLAAIVLDNARVFELPLVGRERERAELLGHLETLLQGLGGIVLVEGEAGVGKTRLLQTLTRDAEWRGVEVLWGEAQEMAPSVPYGPLVEALAGGLSPLRASQLAQLVERIWLQVLALLLPSLTAWVPDLLPPPQLDPAQERDRLVVALGHLLAGWSQIKPLLVVLENLHWVGTDALDVLTRLAPSLGKRGVLVVGSYRGEEAHALPEVWRKLQALDRVGVPHRRVLNGLDAPATSELIRRSLGVGSPAPLFEARLYQETRGNPLFVLETLRVLHGEGLLTRDADGLWGTPWDGTTSDYAELPLPHAVEKTIARRLAGLSPALQQTIQLAAVLGERFDFDLLHAASQAESPALLAALRELVQRRFLDETAQDYRFSHDKVRQVTYDGLDAGERMQLHRQVAHALETLHPDRVIALAHHWAGAAAWDKAAHYHQRAGNQARAVYANVEAVDHYTRALEALGRLPGPVDPLCVFELRLAREAVYGLQGDRVAQAQDLAALAALAALAEQLGYDAHPSAGGSRRAEVALRQALHAEATGDYPGAVASATAAVAAARAAQDTEGEARGYLQWGGALWRQGEYEAAQRQGEQALQLSRAVGLHQLEASSLRLLGSISRYQNDPRKARVYHEQALHVYRQVGDRRSESITLNNLGVFFAWQGDLPTAVSYYEQALDIFREMGDRLNEGLQLNNLGLAYEQLGDFARTQDYLQQALHITREIHDRRGESQALNSLGTVSAKLGEYAQAEDCLQRALHITRELGDRFEESITRYRIGDLYRRLGCYERAQDYLLQALTIKHELGFRQGERWDLSELCRVAYCLGQYEAAREYGRQAMQIAQEFDDRGGYAYGLFLSGQDLLDQGRLAEAAQTYEQTIALCREQGRRAAVAECQAGLARVCLAQGALAQAQAHVEEILRFLESCFPGNPLTGHALAGFGEPFRVVLTCYRVLCANRDPRARDVLDTAYRLVREQTAGIQDPELRRSFLENVPAHREIVAAYGELQAPPADRRATVRLPRANAPLGRALRDDEYVTVAWTVDAPGDDAIPGKAARRHHRILRLLAEAQAQCATPRDKDLAAALSVSLATLRRDMTALRSQGHDLPTRGRKMST